MSKATKKIYGYFWAITNCQYMVHEKYLARFPMILDFVTKIVYKKRDFNGDLRRDIAENNIDFIALRQC